MKISIVICGREKERDFREYEQDLLKRLSPYVKVSLSYISKEEQFFKHIDKSSRLYVLDVFGEEMNSLEFSRLLIEEKTTFFIGQHTGFSTRFKEEISGKAKFLSLSKLTFPHRLCKIILLEQIYRGVCIQKGLPYAK